MRIWVRISVKVRKLPLNFQVPDRGSADAARNAALFRDKTLSPSDPIHKACNLVNQKRKLFPAPRSDFSGWFLSYDSVTGTATTPTAEFRNEYRIPSRLTPTGRKQMHMADVFRAGFRLWLRIDSPMYKCCSYGTLLHVSP